MKKICSTFFLFLSYQIIITLSINIGLYVQNIKSYICLFGLEYALEYVHNTYNEKMGKWVEDVTIYGSPS